MRTVLDSGMTCLEGPFTLNFMSQDGLSMSQVLVLTSKRRHCFLPCNIWSTQSYHPCLWSLGHQRGLLAILSSCCPKFTKCHPRGNHTRKQKENSTHPNIASVLWGTVQHRDCALSSCLGVHTFQMVLCALG